MYLTFFVLIFIETELRRCETYLWVSRLSSRNTATDWDSPRWRVEWADQRRTWSHCALCSYPWGLSGVLRMRFFVYIFFYILRQWRNVLMPKLPFIWSFGCRILKFLPSSTSHWLSSLLTLDGRVLSSLLLVIFQLDKNYLIFLTLMFLQISVWFLENMADGAVIGTCARCDENLKVLQEV